MPPVYEALLLNTVVPQIQAAQAGDSYVMVVNATTPALRITQTGTGDSILVEDAANPDSSPFVVTAAGDVGIGTSSPGTKLDVNGSAYFGNGSNTNAYIARFYNQNTNLYVGVDNAAGSNTGIANNNYFLGLNAHPMSFYTNSTLRMQIDSSGNLGLGVTPSAWSTYKALQVGNGALFNGSVSGTDYTIVSSNAYTDTSATYKYIGSNFASAYYQFDGKHAWFNAPSGFGVGTAATSLTSTQNGNSYTIVSAGNTDFTLIGAANNNVGTTFTKSGGTGTGTGTVSQTVPFTQAMTLDASGNLVIGRTSVLGGVRVESSRDANANYSTTFTTATSIAQLALTDFSSTATYASPAATLLFGAGDTGAGWATISGVRESSQHSAITFATASASSNPVERARITSGGDFRVKGAGTAGSTEAFQVSGSAPADAARLTSGGEFLINASSLSTYFDGKLNVAGRIHAKDDQGAGAVQYVWNTAATGDNGFIDFATEGTYTARGSITYNRAGGLVAYNTTSDYRAKDIIGPFADSGTTIDALKVYNGKMKGATVERPMLIAHEAQAVTPYAVTGEKDAVNDDGTPKYQQMDVSSLVPLLIAEIQSLRARVAQLESKGA